MYSFNRHKSGAAAASKLCLGLLIIYGLIAGLRVAPTSVQAQGPQNLRYDQIKQRFVHNTYSAFRDGLGSIDNIKGVKDEQLLDILLDYRVRAIELDLHPAPTCGGVTPDQPDWSIYHDCFDIVSSNVSSMRSALSMLKAFHDMQPLHEVVTVNLELGSQKNGKGNESEFRRWSADDLDALIRGYLGSNVFTPRDLLTYNNLLGNGWTLAQAVKPFDAGGVKGWPLTDELRGKFIFIIHGDGGSQTPNTDLNKYFRRDGTARYNDVLAFELDESIWKNLANLNANYPWLVFHSEVNLDQPLTGRELRDALPGHILRSKQIDDGNATHRYYNDWLNNFAVVDTSGAHFIYMDLVDTWQYPAFRMFNHRLYPFLYNLKTNGGYLNSESAWAHPSVATKAEPGTYMRIADSSGGDIDDGPDVFTFAHTNLPTHGGPTESWIVEISSRSNGRVHPHGKGFLMARQSLDSRSPYVAVGRTADRYGLRMQYRQTFNGGKEYHEFIPGSRYRENYNVVKLELTRLASGQIVAKAFASAGGPAGPWTQLGPDVTFNVPLDLKGLAVCNNQGYNADNVATYSPDTLSVFDFIGLRKNGAAVSSNIFQIHKVGHAQEPVVWRLDDDGVPCGGQCPKTTQTRIVSTTPNPSNLGDAVTVNFAIDGTTGDFPPTGNVTVYAGEDTCTATVTGTQGSCVLTFTTGGDRGLVANYSGDAHYYPSGSYLAIHHVNRYASTTTLNVSPNPGVWLQPVTLTATVTGTGPHGEKPTGSVIFVRDFDTFEAPLVNGVATYVFPSLSPSSIYTLQALYRNSPYFEDSQASTKLDVICPAITIGPNTLAGGTVLAPYSHMMTATGLPANDHFFYEASATYLPPGLAIDGPSGVLSGTPQAVGSYAFKLGVSDVGSNCRTEQPYTMNIVCPTITLATLPNPQVNTAYNQAATAAPTGGNYVYAVTAGTLPPGLTLNTATGVVSGTPTQMGTFNFTIKATGFKGVNGPPDEAGNYNFFDGACNASRAYSLTVTPICSGPITINPSSLPTGAVGTSYNQTLSATGGTAPYNFAISAGALPNGLVLSTSGTLTGTPTASGAFDFTVLATQANGCQGARAFTLTINAGTTTNGLQFYPLAHPVRLLDTRAGQSGCFTPGTPLAGGAARTQMARGVCAGLSIPPDAKAITGNITTVNSGGGYLTLYPSNAQQPLIANSNYAPNEIINNVFTVGLGTDGAFKIYAVNTTDVVVDLTGYYAPPAANPGGLYFHPLPKPIRLLETRPGQTGCTTPGTPLIGSTDTPQLARLTCAGVTIPAAAQAIVGNATTVSPAGPGYLTLFPASAARPLVASSNYTTNQIVNGPFTVGLSAAGEFKIFTTATTHLVVDVLGYYSAEANDANGAGLLFNPLPRPVRLLETRAGQLGCYTPGAPLSGNMEYTQQARGVCSGETIPATALGLVGNATVVNANGGYLTLWPSNAAKPLVATSNFNAGQVFNRHFTVGLGPDGAFKLFSPLTTDLVVDVSGFFAP